jgi:hypothetical protein
MRSCEPLKTPAPECHQGLGPELSLDHYAAALEALLGYRPELVQLEALELEGVWRDMRAVAEALRLGSKGADTIEGAKRTPAMRWLRLCIPAKSSTEPRGQVQGWAVVNIQALFAAVLQTNHTVFPTVSTVMLVILSHRITGLQGRLAAASAAARGRQHPRVVVVQWSDPLFAAGGWVPQVRGLGR